MKAGWGVICACGHDREVHCHPLFKGERAWCAVKACNCVEFVVYTPDGVPLRERPS